MEGEQSPEISTMMAVPLDLARLVCLAVTGAEGLQPLNPPFL